MNRTPSTPGIRASAAPGVALALLAWLPLAAPAAAQEVPEAVEYCLACHEDASLTLPLDDGSEMGLFVDRELYMGSVHGAELLCTDCHQGYDSDDHPSGATAERPVARR